MVKIYDVVAKTWNKNGPLGQLRRRIIATDPDEACARATIQLDNVVAGTNDPTMQYKLSRVREVGPMEKV